MNLYDELQQLQWKQLQHDKMYHSDIWCLNAHSRIKHMVLHLSKYGAQITVAYINEDDESIKKNFLDAIIICTSLFNILNTSIHEKLAAQLQLRSTNLLELTSELHQLEPNSSRLEAVGGFSANTAIMCKAVESTDHYEAYESRKAIVKAVTALWVLCLRELSKIDPEISVKDAIENRLFGVEEKNIHFKMMRNYKDGF